MHMRSISLQHAFIERCGNCGSIVTQQLQLPAEPHFYFDPVMASRTAFNVSGYVCAKRAFSQDALGTWFHAIV
jgi:hypothetical protein